MTKEQKQHVAYLDAEFSRLMTKKYKAGQDEHGGNLWEKPGLIYMAIDEAIDQVVYLLSLKQQIEAGHVVQNSN